MAYLKRMSHRATLYFKVQNYGWGKGEREPCERKSMGQRAIVEFNSLPHNSEF